MTSRALRRVRVTFWVLVSVAVVSTGVMMRAFAWPAAPATGATLALSGLLGAAAVALAARILVVTGRGG